MKLTIMLQWGNTLLVTPRDFHKLKELITVYCLSVILTVQAKHTIEIHFMAVFVLFYPDCMSER